MTASFRSRRNFLRSSLAGVAGLGLVACSDRPEPGRYTQADIDLLAAQQEAETRLAGKGKYGQHRYRAYRGLAELPWFELDREGQLACVDESIPMATDVHSHLGMSVLFKPRLDLMADNGPARHLFDCDAQEDCVLDLDVYANSNFSEQGLRRLQREITSQGLWGSELARSQTIPALIREMDAMRIQRSVLLPIKLDLPFGDDLTESWRAAVATSGYADRLLTGFSIHPEHSDRIAQLRQHAAAGFKIIKLHPTVQRFYPDSTAMMEIYAVAEELGVTVFFHGGRAGIEPEAAQRYAMPRHYEAALQDFPKVNFILGHAGARDFSAMLALARRHDNAWLGIHGQSLSNLDEMIQATGGERLLFGTDWPFYHIASSLAKVLIVTDDPKRQGIRTAILQANAARLFDQSG